MQGVSYNRRLSHVLICNLDLCFSILILFVKIAKKASKFKSSSFLEAVYKWYLAILGFHQSCDQN